MRRKPTCPRLLNHVMAGEEIIIAKSGKPIARLTAFEAPVLTRRPGLDRGKFVVPDDFDAPLPDEVLDGFRSMKILLDTHCWLWWITTPERLSPEAQKLITDGGNQVFLSAASSWEIAIKCALGKLPLPENPEKFVPPRLTRDAIKPLSINHSHALHVASLPPHHRDPFDRLLISQAQMEGLSIMTVDKQFRLYEVELIWGAP